MTVSVAILAIAHLVVSFLEMSRLDWMVEWNASLRIVQGTPLYAQEQSTLNGRTLGPPMHFPVFFYVLAAVVFVSGSNPYWGRVFLWLCTLILALTISFASGAKNKDDHLLIWLIVLLSPHLFGIEYLGQFDQFTSIFMVIGIHLALQDRHWRFLGGVSLGLGTMTKLFPAIGFGVVTAALLKDKKLNEAAQICAGFVTTVALIFGICWAEFGDKFLDMTVFWQMERLPISSSLWYYWQISCISARQHFWLQLVIMLLTYLIIVKRLSLEKPATIYLGTSAIIVVQLLIQRIVYPHYFFWVFAAAAPAFLCLKREYGIRSVFVWLGIAFCSAIGGFMWGITSVDKNTGLGWQQLGAVISTLGLLAYVAFYIQYSCAETKRAQLGTAAQLSKAGCNSDGKM